MDKLDSDLLRTFLAVTQAGSVTDGAVQIHRSQSATSIQIKHLEAILGHAVFERHGRGVVLSETGRRLLPVAQDVIANLDRTLRDIRQDSVTGKLRLGIPDDHSRIKLAQIIAAFTRQYPQVELDVTCAISTSFPNALKRGQLDLAIYEVEIQEANQELLTEDPTCWVSSVNTDFSTAKSLPVALFDQACWWRDAALKSLDASGMPYRIVYSSQSVSGVAAAVEAGIAVGLLGRSSLHAGLCVAGVDLKLGTTPASKLVMTANSVTEYQPVEAMKAAIRSAFTSKP
ncbi:MAG: LysR substrate-binding domain-containing protein [Pseudomonadota bacterium]